MSHRHMGGEEYELRIVALADDDAPAVIRLRHVLKGLLRQYNFRAASVRDVTPKLPPAASGVARATAGEPSGQDGPADGPKPP